MSKLWKVLGVLVLGLNVDVPAREAGLGMQFNGPGAAALIYAVLVTITLIKVLNHLPGVFALRRPLGVVRSGHEYLWAPAILALLVGFSYRGVFEGSPDPAVRYWTVSYGGSDEPALPLAALGVFALLMWSLKLLAAMREANRELDSAHPRLA